MSIKPNYINADLETVYRGSTHFVPQYTDLGLMPEILPITDSEGNSYETDIYGNTTGPQDAFDYQIVQFLGTFNPPQQLRQELQTRAGLWGAYAGPQLKANVVVNLAYAAEVPNGSQWVNTTKAYHMNNAVWGKTTLAMNMAFWNCGVDPTGTVVEWCYMETGAFEDNVQLKVYVQNMKPFPLAADTLFGQMTGQLSKDTSSEKHATAEMNFAGGAINEAMFGVSSGEEFTKVSKDTVAHKRYGIKPDANQIKRIRASKAVSTFKSIASFWLALNFGLIYVISKTD